MRRGRDLKERGLCLEQPPTHAHALTLVHTHTHVYRPGDSEFSHEDGAW